MLNETASLNWKSGPPLSAMNGSPSRVKSTVSTIPSGPLGVSPGDLFTRSIRLFGKSEVYSAAASSAWPSNHRQGEILDMTVPSPFRVLSRPPVSLQGTNENQQTGSQARDYR